MVSNHPENPDCTKAYMQVLQGQREKAIKTLAAIGYTDAEFQVREIEGFIKFQEAWNTKPKRNRKGARYGRLVETH